MLTLKLFMQKVAEQSDARVIDQAVAVLWFYNYTQAYEEREVSELADDIQEVGLGRPNVTRLKYALQRSKYIVKGKRHNSFQITSRYLSELTKKFSAILNIKVVPESNSVIPLEYASKSQEKFILKLIKQINGTYDDGFYDATAVLVRRLMESLIIQVYIHEQRASEARTPDGKSFLMLEGLLKKVSNDSTLNLSRGLCEKMESIKKMGDTAAHDRCYITSVEDINDLKADIRKVINELLVKSGLH